MPPETAGEFLKLIYINKDEATVEPAWVQQLDQLIFKIRNILRRGSKDVGCATGMEHEIHLTNQVPSKLLYRPTPSFKIPKLKLM